MTKIYSHAIDKLERGNGGRGRTEKEPGFRGDHKTSESGVTVPGKLGHQEASERPGHVTDEEVSSASSLA